MLGRTATRRCLVSDKSGLGTAAKGDAHRVPYARCADLADSICTPLKLVFCAIGPGLGAGRRLGILLVLEKGLGRSGFCALVVATFMQFV